MRGGGGLRCAAHFADWNLQCQSKHRSVQQVGVWCASWGVGTSGVLGSLPIGTCRHEPDTDALLLVGGWSCWVGTSGVLGSLPIGTCSDKANTHAVQPGGVWCEGRGVWGLSYWAYCQSGPAGTNSHTCATSSGVWCVRGGERGVTGGSQLCSDSDNRRV